MDKNLIDAAIKRIQNSSEQEYNNIFGNTSDGKEILKEDVEKYDKNVGIVGIVSEFSDFLHNNNGNAKDIIKKYLEYSAKLNALSINPESFVNEEEQLDAASIRKFLEEAPARVEEKRASMFTKASDGRWILSNYIEPYEVMLNSVKLAAENDELRRENSELKASKVETSPTSIPVQPEPAPSIPEENEEPIKEIPLMSPETPDNDGVVVEPSTYYRKSNEIIQDLPVMDTTSAQEYSTPGMTNEEILDSQNKLGDIDPIQAEINARYNAKYNSRQFDESYADDPDRGRIVDAGKERVDNEKDFYPEGTAPDQSEAINDFLNSVNNRGVSEPAQPKPNDKRKKVVSRRAHSWGNAVKKKIAQLKGILFKENRRGRSVNYLAFCTELANFRAKYKDNSYETNMDALKNIGTKAGASSSLTFDERRRIMGKLTRLEKAVVRLARKNNEIDSLGSMGR